jgi:hypothetical protein
MALIDTKTLTRGLIAWMRREGVAPTRTRLVKFLYLADLQHARYKGGETITGWRWYTGPFGPVAVEALRLLDDGVKAGWLRRWDAGEDDQADDERRAVGYDLLDADATLDGSMPLLLGKVRDWIKRYGDSTPRLLRFVYGNTEPMELARDGDVLDFARARPPGPGPAIDSHVPKKQAKKLDELMKRLRLEYAANRSSVVAFPDGPHDEEYYAGTPEEDRLPSAEFILRFPNRGEE